MRCFACMNEVSNDADFCPECGAKIVKTNSALQLPIGTALNGKYEIGQALGEGGFGITYVGYDSMLQMKVAIKEFFPKDIVTRNGLSVECVSSFDDHGLYHSEKEKVINEAVILAKFSKTPGIVGVREYFEENNTAYIVLEYLNGETLQDYINRKGKMNVPDAFSMLLPIMQVLEKIHQENIIHRDISPDNMMFDDGQLKLLDFGAARQVLFNSSKSLSVMLKHGYAPEEQYRRKGKQGPWTDVYSVCATLYYCITNSLPDTSLDRMHEDELAVPSSLGCNITDVQEKALLRGLSVFPEDRFQSIADFISAWNGQEIPQTNPDRETVVVRKTDEQKSCTIATAFGGDIEGVSLDDGWRDVQNADVSKESVLPKKSKKGVICGISAGAFVIVVVIVASILINSNSDNKLESDKTTNDPITTVQTSKTLEDYFDEADSYAVQKKYTEALAVLDTAESKFPENASVEQKRVEVNKLRVEDRLIEYDNKNDLAGAIKYLNAEIASTNNDEELTTKLSVYKSKYRDNAIQNAESVFKSSGYEEAISGLNKALKVLPNDKQINNAIEKYSEYAPIDITSLTYFTGHDFGSKSTEKDNLGDIRNNITYPLCQGWSNATTTNVYKVDKKYSLLTGVWFQYFEYRTSNLPYSDYKGNLDIYGDGKLLYSGEMGPGVEPKNIELNISGVTELKIHYFGGGGDGSYSGIENFQIRK